jgi:hypothetical protein
MFGYFEHYAQFYLSFPVHQQELSEAHNVTPAGDSK